MPVPTVITDLTAVAASNSPAGSENTFPSLDDYLRAHASFIKQNYDSLSAKANTSAPAFTGTVSMSGGGSFGNTAVTSTTVLDWYEEGTFTPTLSFTASSTGITYGSRSGAFTRVGNLVTFWIFIDLTSKGSATGDVRLNGLPYTIGSVSICGVQLATVTGFTGAYYGIASPGVTYVAINQSSATGAAGVTDANLTNSSAIWASGTYKV